MEDEIVEVIEPKAEPEILEFLLSVRGLREVAKGILVGDKTISEWASVQPEVYKDLTYLWEEWDYVYLTESQYSDLTNT